CNHHRERIRFINHYLRHMEEGRFECSSATGYYRCIGTGEQIVGSIKDDFYRGGRKIILVERRSETGGSCNYEFVAGKFLRKACNQGHQLLDFHFTADGK